MQKLTFTDWLAALKNASSFDLYRLNALIDDELINPQRTLQMLASIRIGQELQYYDARTHKQSPCRIIDILQKYVLIHDLADGKRYKIPPYMLNLDGQSVDIDLHQGEKISRHHIAVGDNVGFVSEKAGYLEGNVIRLNQKTVTLHASDGREWRVAYDLLQRPTIEV